MPRALNGRNSYRVIMCSVFDRRGDQFEGGRYKAWDHASAARKAAKSIFTAIQSNPDFQHNQGLARIVFKLRQTTKRGEHPEIIFEANKQPPSGRTREIVLSGKTIVVSDDPPIDVRRADESSLLQAIKVARKHP